ncbi:MAG: hypothetical protein Q8Q23_06460 [bacterium]|nr:hypothetical protein [bacterium]
MSDNEAHEVIIKNICDHACKVLKYPNLQIKIMRRQGSVNTKKSYIIGHTSLRTGVVTLDVYTPRHRKPKKVSSILSVLAHEVAHHQKLPYRQWHRGRWIIRQHYPQFYKQVTKNINKMKKDEMIGKYFT